MKKIKLFFLLVTIVFLFACEKENPVELSASPIPGLYYKIEHEEGAYPYPVNPTGVVIKNQGCKYGIATGETVYIKNNTALDFWFEPDIQKTSWTLEQVGHGGSTYDNISTLKTGYTEQGEYQLTVNLPTGIYRVKILVH